MFIKFSIVLLLYCYVGVKSVAHGAQSGIRQLQCNCGRANDRTSKIIGGAVVTPHKYPWVVTVYTGQDRVCGGSLITRQYVLTAAHCVLNKANINVGIAVHDQHRPGQRIPASILKIHADYRGKPQYDVALIKLQKGVMMSERVRTLCLPHNLRYEQPGRYAIAAGWGSTHPSVNSQSQFLKEVNMRIEQADSAITAQGANQTGACTGDSGSPLFTRYSDGRFHIIGVTSTGTKPCIGRSQYARVSALNQWIMQNIMDSVPCAMAADQIASVETNDL